MAEGGTADAQSATWTATHYAAFVQLCRTRIQQLGLSYESADDLFGFPRGYTSKLLVGMKNCSCHSLFVMARGLALMPSFTPDAVELARLRQHSAFTPITHQAVLARRRSAKWRSQHCQVSIKPGPDYRRLRAQAAGLGNLKRSAKSRRMQARKAALARWSRAADGTSSAPQE
jgi:hypothetical protein